MKPLTKARRWTVALVVVALAGLAAIPATLRAADHLDAPGLTSPGDDGSLDIADVYAFQSPVDTDNTVLIMTVNPAAGVLSPDTFNVEASYEFLIDEDGDAKKDRRFKVEFGAPDSDGEQDLKLVANPSGGVVARGSTGEDVAVDGGGTLRADIFDDPFFFDLNAFLGVHPFCEFEGRPGNGDDFFAGLNVSAIVLEIPSDSFGDSEIGVWARTTLDGDQVDRMGRPAINTVFIPSENKDEFNETKPRNDARKFSDFLGDFTAVLLPDILTVDVSDDAGFLNGRQVDDDVIDAELALIGNDPASDCVDGNDVAFPGTFPYLAEAHSG